MSGPISTLLHSSEMKSQHLELPLTDSPCSLHSLQLCYFSAPWFRSSGCLQLDLGVYHHGSSCTAGTVGMRNRRIAGYDFYQFRKKKPSAIGPTWSLTSREWRTINKFQPWEEQTPQNRPRSNYRRILTEPRISLDSGRSNDSRAWAEDILRVQAR